MTEQYAPGLPRFEVTWAGRVEKTNHPQEPALTWGTRGASATTTPAEVAFEMITETRVGHPDYTGPLTVSLWRLPDRTDETRLPHDHGPIPDDAYVTEVPGTTAAPAATWSEETRAAVDWVFSDDPGPMPTRTVDAADKPLPTADTATQAGRTWTWAYQIEKADPVAAADPTRARMSLGTRQFPTDWAPRQVADELAEENRAGHSYYRGGLTVAVWLYSSNTPERHPNHTGRAPWDAHHFRYEGEEPTGDAAAAVTDQPDDVDEATRAAWNAKTLGAAGRMDPAQDPNFRPLLFVGGPWHGQTKYQAKAFWPIQSIFLMEWEGGETSIVSAPDYPGDDRPRYSHRPSSSAARTLMVWHDPKGFDPMDLLLSRASRDPLVAAAFEQAVDHARQIRDTTPPFGDEDYPFQAAVARAGRDAVAVALHRLAAHLPDVTDAQRQFLDAASATLGLDVVETLTGTQTPGDDVANAEEQEMKP